jgi:glycine cleavage system T protein (aminomethyltransferase)
MGETTPLHTAHIDAGAKMVDFGGWDMPIHYGSQIEEHHAVRRTAGMFDVSHMTVVDITGTDAKGFLRQLLANDVAKLTTRGKALYTCMLDPQGGIIDDLITYYRDDDNYRLVVNAGTRAKDLAWIRTQATGLDLEVVERPELAMIAVQGPRARDLAAALLPEADRATALALKPFNSCDSGELFIARTGYTGEDGFEITLPAERAVEFWNGLLAAGVAPCGLGARDTLRLEAGMNLYGIDMDEQVTPLESALAWTVAFEPADRGFNGRSVLEAQRDRGPEMKFVGLLLEGRGVLRGHQLVHAGEAGSGEVTSGTYSPTLERSIGFARIPAQSQTQVEVEIRGKMIPARVMPLTFVRNGQVKVEL